MYANVKSLLNNNNNGNGQANNTPSGQIKRNVHRRLLEMMDLTEARRMPVEQLHAECSRATFGPAHSSHRQ